MVTDLDHEANVSTWLVLEGMGAKFLWWKRRQILGRSVVAHLPPEEFRPHAFHTQPGRHIGFVVQIRDHNLRRTP